ncbi:hypothetical protein Salat_0602100 [Sesamum alatum]|uniref:Uncharacterized protein n=1 Tax=Sesamum alatum TaxID=300844 RepID=A0AAE1YR20_9LAMI|nr:hypothetical protein Salat_0602100 [Sesamum alatum]
MDFSPVVASVMYSSRDMFLCPEIIFTTPAKSQLSSRTSVSSDYRKHSPTLRENPTNHSPNSSKTYWPSNAPKARQLKTQLLYRLLNLLNKCFESMIKFFLVDPCRLYPLLTATTLSR